MGHVGALRKRHAFQKLEKLLDVKCDVPWEKIALGIHMVTAETLEALALRIELVCAESYENGARSRSGGLP